MPARRASAAGGRSTPPDDAGLDGMALGGVGVSGQGVSGQKVGGGGMRGTANRTRPVGSPPPGTRRVSQPLPQQIKRSGSISGGIGGRRASGVNLGERKPSMKRSNSNPSLGNVSKLVDDAPLPPDAELKFWQIALLYPGGGGDEDGDNSAKNTLSVEWFLLLEKEKRKSIIDRCAVLGIGPQMAKQVVKWEYRAQAAARGVRDVCDSQLFGVVDKLKANNIKGTVLDTDKEKIAEGKKKAVRKKEQCDPEMLKKEAVSEREKLKDHPLIVTAVEELWAALPKCPEPHKEYIDRQVYTWMSLRILESVLPEAEREGVLPSIVQDWWSESNEEFFMDYSAFFEGIYTYVDVWCPEISAPKYKRRIDQLTKLMVNGRITFHYALKLAERHWAEWLEKVGCPNESAAFAEGNFFPKMGARGVTPLSPAEFPFIENSRYTKQRQDRQMGSFAGMTRRRSSAAVSPAKKRSPAMNGASPPNGSMRKTSNDSVEPRLPSRESRGTEKRKRASTDRGSTGGDGRPPKSPPVDNAGDKTREEQNGLEVQLLELARTLDDHIDTTLADSPQVEEAPSMPSPPETANLTTNEQDSELAAKEVSSKRDLVNHHKSTPPPVAPHPPSEGTPDSARPFPAA